MTMLDLLRRFATATSCWLRQRRERRQLVSLSDHTLRDLGLTRSDVEGIYAQPFWRRVDYAELDARRRSRPGLGSPLSVNHTASIGR